MSSILLNTSPKSHLQKRVLCNPHHTWALVLETPCEAMSPNFHALTGRGCMY